MKYRQQLYFIISFIGLRLLTLVLYVFFKPAQPGPYTPYILFLYTLFDVLIICYLYRFVKKIKHQALSLFAVWLVVIHLVFTFCLDFFFPRETREWSVSSYILADFINAFVHVTGKLLIAYQLIVNKAKGHLANDLKILGWSYVVLFLLGLMLIPPFIGMVLEYHPVMYALQLSSALPLAAMLLLYVNELKNDPDLPEDLGSSIIDTSL